MSQIRDTFSLKSTVAGKTEGVERACPALQKRSQERVVRGVWLDAKTVFEITFGKNGIVVVRANVYARVCISKREDTVSSRSRDRTRPRTRGEGRRRRARSRSIDPFASFYYYYCYHYYCLLHGVLLLPLYICRTLFGSEPHKKFKYFRRPRARAHASFLVLCNKNSVPFFEYKSSRQNVILRPLRFAAPFVILHVFHTIDTFYV